MADFIPFGAGHGLSADDLKPVAPEILRNVTHEIEALDEQIKDLSKQKSEAMKAAKAKGIKMKPFRLFLKNRRRSREEVSEEQRVAEGYQDIMSGANVRV